MEIAAERGNPRRKCVSAVYHGPLRLELITHQIARRPHDLSQPAFFCGLCGCKGSWKALAQHILTQHLTKAVVFWRKDRNSSSCRCCCCCGQPDVGVEGASKDTVLEGDAGMEVVSGESEGGSLVPPCRRDFMVCLLCRAQHPSDRRDVQLCAEDGSEGLWSSEPHWHCPVPWAGEPDVLRHCRDASHSSTKSRGLLDLLEGDGTTLCGALYEDIPTAWFESDVDWAKASLGKRSASVVDAEGVVEVQDFAPECPTREACEDFASGFPSPKRQKFQRSEPQLLPSLHSSSSSEGAAAVEGIPLVSISAEKDKMLSGQLYVPTDALLSKEAHEARQMMHHFNNLHPDLTTEKARLTQEMFGSCGEGCYITPPIRFDYGKNIFLGDFVYMNFGATILDVCPVHIGSRTLFGPNVQVFTATHPLEPELRKCKEYGRPISIGCNVWVGGGSILCPGVTIGDNSVIGAGSVVTKNVPPNVVAVGNPCRVMRVLPREHNHEEEMKRTVPTLPIP